MLPWQIEVKSEKDIEGMRAAGGGRLFVPSSCDEQSHFGSTAAEVGAPSAPECIPRCHTAPHRWMAARTAAELDAEAFQFRCNGYGSLFGFGGLVRGRPGTFGGVANAQVYERSGAQSEVRRVEGGEDIKMVSGGSKFLKELLSRPGVIFGYVKKAAGKLDNFVEVLVDGKYQGTFQQQQADLQADTTYTRYCYHFESLLTALREFKAIKQLEFTRLCPILCYPTLSLQYREHMVEEHCKAVTECFAQYDDMPELYPKVYAEDEERSQLVQ